MASTQHLSKGQQTSILKKQLYTSLQKTELVILVFQPGQFDVLYQVKN